MLQGIQLKFGNLLDGLNFECGNTGNLIFPVHKLIFQLCDYPKWRSHYCDSHCHISDLFNSSGLTYQFTYKHPTISMNHTVAKVILCQRNGPRGINGIN